MIDARAARFRLSPSRLARFYFHECERHLRFAATPSSRRAAEGIPDLELDQSIVTKAILDAGDAWEERLLDQLGDRALIAGGPPTARASEQRHSVEDTVGLLQALEPGRHVYQATLRAPAGFYEAYGLDPSLVAFVDCHPDLVTCVDGERGRELRVIDAKASDMMKLSHRIQVALYTLILRHVMAAVPGAPTVSTVGGVWLTDQPEPEWFSLAEVLPPLEVFLAHDLTPLLETPASEAFWHLYYRCEWCDYFAHCRSEAERTDDVSLVPYLSTFAKRHLTASAGVATVQDLDELLATPDGDRRLAGCASLEGRGPRLRRQVEALRRGEALDTGHAALAMPVGEQVRLVVTLQSEPVTGACYGYAFNRVFGKEIFDGSTNATVSRVATSGREPDLVALRRHLVRDLMDVLGTVHHYNAQRADDWWAQKGLQSYVFDEYERELLVRELLVAVLDEEVGPDALRLTFHFHHPDLAGADDHPAEQVAFPVVVLMQVLRSAMALPSHVAYRFADAVAAVRPSAYAFDYRQDDFWSFELSNRLKSTAVMTAWRDDRTDLLESIEQELRRRVWAANSVINGIREHLQGTSALFAWPPKLMLPPSLSFRHPSLSRLAFIARYERLLGGLQQRGLRALPEDERSTLRDVIPLQATGPDTFRLMRTPDVEITASDFTAWLLSREDEEGRRGRLAFDDHANCNAFWVPKKVPVALAAVTDVDTTELTLSITPSKAFATPQAGERFVLEPRFTDFTTQRPEKELAALDQAQDPWFVRVIEAPAAARSTPETAPEVREAALALADRHGMTASQRAAFAGVLDNDLQLVWGPPGTGKTHFIALAVICPMEAHRAADLPFRVLLTACTHTALDNLLAKVRTLADEMGVQGLPVAKVGREEHIQASEAATWASGKPVGSSGRPSGRSRASHLRSCPSTWSSSTRAHR
ncbi:MAG: AAA domain-containing protein [Thermoleophilia bacterium]